jgi:hypothetical protein
MGYAAGRALEFDDAAPRADRPDAAGPTLLRRRTGLEIATIVSISAAAGQLLAEGVLVKTGEQLGVRPVRQVKPG